MLEAGLKRAHQGVAALEAPAAIKPEKRSLVTGPFALGVKIPLAGGRLQSLAFTFHRDDDDAREPLRRWDHPTLRALLTPSPGAQEAAAGDALLLVLFDAHGRPVGSAHAVLAAARDPAILDLGSFNSLGSAKSWSLTILSKDGPHSVAPADPSPRTVAEAIQLRPGEVQVVQVDAVPDWRWSQFGRGAQRRPDAAPHPPVRRRRPRSPSHTLELVSRDYWKDLLAKATLVLLDEQDVPVAIGSVEHRYRVERDVYDDANLSIPLRERTAKAGAVKGVAGVQTVTIGGPMGSFWGMYMNTESPYPIESLLAGDDPQVWRRGLAVLDDEAGTSSLRRNVHNRDNPTIDQKTWGAIHRALRPHSDHLAPLFPRAAEAGPRILARLCLLAGYSGDQRLVEPLKARLDAQDDAVRDAAATGLGLLGNRDGRARLEAIIARPDPSDAAAKFEADQRKAEAKRGAEPHQIMFLNRRHGKHGKKEPQVR